MVGLALSMIVATLLAFGLGAIALLISCVILRVMDGYDPAGDPMFRAVLAIIGLVLTVLIGFGIRSFF
jgi:hypothetical protein